VSQAVDLRHLDYARRGGKLYIAGEDWNFAWMQEELETVQLIL